MKPLQLSLCLLLVAIGCKSTSLTTTWKDPSADLISFRRIVVVVLNASPPERRSQEDALVQQIKRGTATPSYELLTDDELKDVSHSKQKIVAAGFDGVALLRLVDKRQQTTYVPPETTWDEWDHRANYSNTTGYAVTDTIIRAEVSLYTVPGGKLLWAGSSETVNPTDAATLAREVAQATAAELKKQGLIP